MNSISALRCADHEDVLPTSRAESSSDSDDDPADPYNQEDPTPRCDLPRVPAGKVFHDKESVIQELIRRAEMLQETRSPDDVMPPKWLWTGQINKRARKKM